MNPVQSAIMARRSIRDYEATQLTDEQLALLLEAGLAAPSAINSQPWHFTVVQDQRLLDRIHEAAKCQILSDPKSASPRWNDESFHIFYHAPTVIFLSANAIHPLHYGEIDCGIAVQNIALAAQGMGLGSVILGMPRAAFEGQEGDDIRKECGMPEEYDFKIAIAVGTAKSSKDAHPIGEGKINYIR